MGAAEVQTHEVRGVWFATARAEVEARFGAEALEVLVAGTPAAHRAALIAPDAGAWYPEEALQACLHSLRMQLAGGRKARFDEVLEACTERGMGMVFASLLRLTTPRFLISKVPMMWRQIRRGPGYVEVDSAPERSVLRYRSFPYFEDPVYEELTVSSVRAILRLCTRVDPKMSVERVTRDELDLRVEHP